MPNQIDDVMRNWNTIYETDAQREFPSKSHTVLIAAICRGANLRAFSMFRWWNHMGMLSLDQGMVEETVDL